MGLSLRQLLSLLSAALLTLDVTASEALLLTGGIAAPPVTNPLPALSLKNPSGSVATGAHMVTLGQVFLKGAAPNGTGLASTINGSAAATQLDCKTTYNDGSCNHGIITINAPNISTSTTYPVTLSSAAGGGTPMDMHHACDAWSEIVTIVVFGGSTYTEDICTLLSSALSGGTYRTWRSGPQVTEIRLDDVYLTSSLYFRVNIAYYVDGSVETDLQLNNDRALTGSGGPVTLTEQIVQNGSTVVNYQTQPAIPAQAWDATHLSCLGGGSLGATTYYVKATLTNAAGETLPTAEASIACGANTILYVSHPGTTPGNPFSQGGASGFKVYVSTSPGTETLQGAAGIDPSSNDCCWLEPTSGLVTGAAPPVTNTATQTIQQYQNHHDNIWSNGAPKHLVVQDTATFEKAGALIGYDLAYPTTRSDIFNNEVGTLYPGYINGGGWGGFLPVNNVHQWMPDFGGRIDLGRTTEPCVLMLMSYDPVATQVCLGWADVAGSAPWNFFDPASNLDAKGAYASVYQYPNLWVASGTAAGLPNDLTQAVPSGAVSGWVTEIAHPPMLSYVAYLLTGRQRYLDQLNAHAAWSILGHWPGDRFQPNVSTPTYRDIVAGQWDGGTRGGGQERAQAWSSLVTSDAAYANPDGSAEKTYFTSVLSDNYAWLISQIPSWTTAQGEAYGQIINQDTINAGNIEPWNQDYFANWVINEVLRGNTSAKTVLDWLSNFLIQRFYPRTGWNQHNSAAYALVTYNSTNHVFYQTWAAVQTATETTPIGGSIEDNGVIWHSVGTQDNNYPNLAIHTLAGLISVYGTATRGLDAMQAFGWLYTSGAPLITQDAQFQTSPQMPDGVFVYSDHILIDTSNTNVTLTCPNKTCVLSTNGTGSDILNGGTGADLLYAGSRGNNTLNAGTGNQFMFGPLEDKILALSCTGTNKFVDNTGNNYMRGSTWCGANTYEFGTNNSGQDTIANFRLGTDVLRIKSTLDGHSFASAAAFTATCTVSGSDTVCDEGGGNTITLEGVTSSLTSSVTIF